MSAVELMEWHEYHRLHPLPDANWLAAQLCQVVANSMRAKGPPYSLEDFLPRVGTARKSPEDLFAGLCASLERGR